LYLSLFVAIRQVCPDVMHANSFYGGPICVLLGLFTRTRVVVHARDLAKFGFFTRMTSACSARLIAVSRSVREELISQGATAEQICIVYNGIDRKEAKRQGSRVPSGHSYTTDSEQTFTYANIGQFVPWKKQSMFLDAALSVCQQLPQARFVVVGDDLFGRDSRYKRELFSQVDSSEIASKASFLGWQEDMDETWEGIDCLVHAADKEPFGRVVIEAMAHQIPVIAVDSCGPSEIIQHEETGLLVEPNDTGQLVEAMIRIAQDRSFAGRLAAKGYEHVCASFTATETASTVNRIYSDVLN